VATLPRVVLSRDDLVLGDPAPSNLVFKDGEIAGVVDFECAGRGDLLIDVVALMERFRHRGEFLDALLNAEFSADRFRAVRLCGTATVLSGLNWRLQQGQPTANALTAAEELLDLYWDLTLQ
jgi:aminoglycoside phosphotransferase (APT) family kinase protein